MICSSSSVWPCVILCFMYTALFRSFSHARTLVLSLSLSRSLVLLFSRSLALSLSFLSIDGGSFVSKRQLHRGTSVWAVQRKQETHMWR